MRGVFLGHGWGRHHGCMPGSCCSEDGGVDLFGHFGFALLAASADQDDGEEAE
jgi:hypothetical protein